jgi:antitoxin (DNA-binding transcriptional repressor) of toxin-antitoxin stability system
MNHHSRTWSLQDAKARLSEVIKLAQIEGPQIVTVHGAPAVTISKIVADEKPKLSGLTGADFLKAMQAGPKFDIKIPPRPKYGKFRDFSFD